ncbi:hypothetical protein S83_004250 [Arachis hypogaea]
MDWIRGSTLGTGSFTTVSVATPKNLSLPFHFRLPLSPSIVSPPSSSLTRNTSLIASVLLVPESLSVCVTR